MLQKILHNREERAKRQKSSLLLYSRPIVSICVNIPGAKKLSIDAIFIYETMYEILKKSLKCDFKECFLLRQDTGIEGIISVDMKADELKKLTCKLENEEFLGRFIDLDVLDVGRKILSRKDFNLPPRRCFICDEKAVICARSKKHSEKSLLEHIAKRVSEFKYMQNVAKRAKIALVVEVELTPKPGLVDCKDNGSHKDMDIQTFYKSIDAIAEFFMKFLQVGYESSQDDRFEDLRAVGKECEKAMYEATNGVNTHKGMIFSLAVILGSMGSLVRRKTSINKKDLQKSISYMCRDLMQKDFKVKKEHETPGERYFQDTKKGGIRQEAQNGYKNIFDISLPYYLECKEKFNEDRALKMTLLRLMSLIDDTSIYNRGGLQALKYAKKRAKECLKNEDIDKSIRELNEDFIEKNLSAGGSADMLALTKFLSEVCEDEK